jgi:hypothetical protein
VSRGQGEGAYLTASRSVLVRASGAEETAMDSSLSPPLSRRVSAVATTGAVRSFLAQPHPLTRAFLRRSIYEDSALSLLLV